MIRPTKKLRARTLTAEALGKVQGGRGSYCGASIHCECGCAADTASWFVGGYGYALCPSCGAPQGRTSD